MTAQIRRKIEMVEAMASTLLKEATSLRLAMGGEAATSPSTRKGLSAKEVAKLKTRTRKTISK